DVRIIIDGCTKDGVLHDELVLAGPWALTIAAVGGGAEAEASITAVESAWSSSAWIMVGGGCTRNVNGPRDFDVAGGEQVNRGVQRITIKSKSGAAVDGDRGAIENAIGGQIEGQVTRDIERTVSPSAAGIERLGLHEEAHLAKYHNKRATESSNG